MAVGALSVQYVLNSMSNADRSIAEFVEAMGIRFSAQAGTPPMTGRVLGWLLVCDPPAQTAAELARALEASKGSISTATRMLERIRLVERVTRPGERVARFVVRTEAWPERMRDTQELRAFRDVLRQGVQALADAPAERRGRLRELDEFYAWAEQRLPALWDEWRARER